MRQAARETSAGKNSAMLAVMRQRRQAEEDERRAKEQRDARAARIKVRKSDGDCAFFFFHSVIISPSNKAEVSYK